VLSLQRQCRASKCRIPDGGLTDAARMSAGGLSNPGMSAEGVTRRGGKCAAVCGIDDALLGGMRLLTGLLWAGTLAIAGLSPGHVAAADATTDRSVFALRIVRDAGEVRGTCVLIHREDRGNDVSLYFLTSSRLFKAPDGTRHPLERTIQLLLDEGRTLDVKREDVLVASGNFLDVTVFRVLTPKATFRVLTANTTLLPRPVVFDPPRAGSAFHVSGYDQTAAPVMVGEHIRFESTRQVLGDRDASGLIGCVGAPAIAPEGVFGVVRECEPNRCPVISLLSIARRFIERQVPRPTTHASPTSQVDIVDSPATLGSFGPQSTNRCTGSSLPSPWRFDY